jgi:hypothetical protein
LESVLHAEGVFAEANRLFVALRDRQAVIGADIEHGIRGLEGLPCGLNFDIQAMPERTSRMVILWVTRSFDRLIASHPKMDGGVVGHSINVMGWEMYMQWLQDKGHHLFKVDTDSLDDPTRRQEFVANMSTSLGWKPCETCGQSWRASNKDPAAELSDQYAPVVKVQRLRERHAQRQAGVSDITPLII